MKVLLHRRKICFSFNERIWRSANFVKNRNLYFLFSHLVRPHYWCHYRNVFTPISENPNHHPPKVEAFSHEIHLKIPLWSWGWKISNSNLNSSLILCISNRKDTTNGFSDSSSITWVLFFSFFFQDEPLFHCWILNRGLKVLRNLRTAVNVHIFTSVVYACSSAVVG